MISELSNGMLASELWGNKASRLSEVQQLGFVVPPALCIQAETLLESDGDAVEAWLQTRRPSKVILRTSSSLEDTAERARAGHTVTVANCEPYVEELLETIARDFRPHFEAWSAKASGYCVMFQEQVFPQLAGVAFYSPAEFIIELSSSGATDQVTSGMRPDVTIRSDRLGFRAEGASLSGTPIVSATRDIHRVCRVLWEHFGFPLDLEWAWVNGAPTVLQVRPLTQRTGG